jgi:nucleoside-diphosphate-sugar epimerase
LESTTHAQQQKWTEKNIIVTGGASFIGSHLVDKLVNFGANVTVIDNLSSGKLENLSQSKNNIKFVKKDLEYVSKDELFQLFRDQHYVFHLAAIHGGRGFISSHPADVCSNLSIDHHVFEASMNSNIENLVFASTACVYPTNLQKDIGSDYKLRESDSNPFDLETPLSADIEYGWGKLMSEIQLNSFKKQYGLKCCPVRFVTAYGPRENETHAIIALIYKAVEKMNPFEVWGNGQQERDFTYVEDIVSGTIKAGEMVNDCTPINLGTGKRYKIIDVVEMIFKILKWHPKNIIFDDSKPVGALSRALDNSRANNMLHWKPEFNLEEGLKKTIDWYVSSHKIEGEIGAEKLFNH